jgi:purine-binding chemotaxis protein CheW
MNTSVQGYDMGQSNTSGVPADSDQYLTFTVGNEEYGVEIMTVREIRQWAQSTRLPNTPSFMLGVMNLRGAIIPIFDLRARFSGEKTEADSKNVIIIVALSTRLIGILVDTVSDIVHASAAEIKAPPSMELNIDERYVNGLISLEERMIVLLDVEHLFDAQTLKDAVQATTAVNH